MPVQTFEAVTDDHGNVRFAPTVHLPAHTKVYVVVPEQTTPYGAIVPNLADSPPAAVRFPLVRIEDEALAKRLIKTVVENTDAGV